MTPPQDDQAAHALAEIGWLRRLAGDLCTDPHAADDAVQDTLAAALRHRPDASRPLHGWLATVLHNALRGARRSAARTAMREAAAARREAQPSAADSAARVELQERVLAAVRALPEPLRATVVARYFDELPPRRIAAQHGLPVATVKARLVRGLHELRLRLDQSHGGERRAWVLALAALQPVAGTLAMKKTTLLAGGAVAALLAVTVPLWMESAPTAPAPAHTGPVAAASAAIDRPQPTEPTSQPDRAVVTPQPAAEASTTSALQASAVGIVVDVLGRPLASMSVRNAAGARATTAADGRFELFGNDSGSAITVDAPGWATVFGAPDRRGVRERVVVAAPAIALGGRVVEADGRPVERARVAVQWPAALRGSLPFVLDDSNAVESETFTDAKGSFALAPVAAVPQAVLRVAGDGFVTAEVPLPAASNTDMRVTLARRARSARTLAGRVLDARGAPAADALVLLEAHSTRAAADGTFALDLGDKEPPRADAELFAMRPGALPARQRSTANADGSARWPDPLVLQLGGPTLSIEGHVRSADGAPRANVRVWVNRLEFVGERTDPARPDVTDDCYLENELRGVAPGWQPVTTDAAGAFRIDGLVDRDYHVTALEDGTALRVDREHVRAGSADLVLQFDADGLLPEVHGVVTDRRGQPLRDVQVRVTTDAYSQYRDGQSTGTWHQGGASTHTDTDGRFTLQGVPRQRAYLRFSGDEVMPDVLGRGGTTWPFADGQELRMELRRRCHFQVELLDAGAADRVTLLDGAGKALSLSEFDAHGAFSSDRMPIHDGHTSVLATTDDAATLVLKLDRREVRRVPIALVPGQLTVLRY